MTDPHPLAGIMGPQCFEIYDAITPLATERDFYLIGGTALAMQLHHRTSTDLDFFLHGGFDPAELLGDLRALGLPTVVNDVSEDTLNVVCGPVRVQFLCAEGQSRIADLRVVGQLRQAAIPDILAMKLTALLGRAKLRDYFDVMVIDRDPLYPVELGIAFHLRRYSPLAPEQTAIQIVQALGYLDDVEDDATVPISREEIVDFWHKRQPQVAANLSRSTVGPGSAL